jgi:hypothetical protein
MPHPKDLKGLAFGSSMVMSTLYLSNHVVAVVNFPGHRAADASDCKSEIEDWVVLVLLIDSLVVVFE